MENENSHNLSNPLLPDKQRPEWRLLVKGEKEYPLTNFVLQLKVNQTAIDIKKGKLSVEKAVDEIYNLCEKYKHAVVKDMKVIFSSN
jgi:poly(A) polymerase Pap1